MWSSLRIAVRSLTRRPAVPLVAIASLAVGIGVNSAVFSMVDAIFLRPPAVRAPENLVEIRGHFRDSGDAILDWSDCQAVASAVPAFSAATASMERGGLWRNGNETTLLLVSAVGNNYFEMLGVKPFLGRFPDAHTDFAADPAPPLVLTYWVWRERMGGRPDIIGRPMEFRDHVWRIAAVLPPEFRGLSSMDQRHVWIPLGSWARFWPRDLERGSGQFEALARLRPGVSLDQARAQLELLARRIEAGDSRVPRGRRLVASALSRPLRERLQPGMLIMAVVGLVLLVACANVAAVLLAHAEARRREIGLRLSLGAGRLALARQFLAESGVLALAGAAAGLLLAGWLLDVVPLLAPPSAVPLHFDFLVDRRMLLFTGLWAAATLLVFGLAPLGYAVRVSLLDAISGTRAAGRRPRPWWRYTLVAGQVALSVVLVAGALLLRGALRDAGRIYPGYDTSRPLAVLSVYFSGSGSEQDAFQQASSRVAALPGVEAVTYARHLPLTDSGSGATISVVPEGASPDAAPPRIYFNLVGPRFFEVAGARMNAGRVFADADHGAAPPVAILNAEAARRFWAGQNPLDKVLRIRKQSYRVVGITADGRIAGLHEHPAPAVFLPASRMPWGETLLIARTKADPAVMLKDLVRAASRTEGLRVFESTTLRSIMRGALYMDWIPTVLGGFLALVGLLLAAGGLYGAVSYATERRLAEFGIRMAVGAQARQIAGLVVRQAVGLCLVGVPMGIGLMLFAYRYYAAALLDQRPLEWPAICAGAAVAVATVLAGAILPALRAARLDPLAVLRAE